MFEQQTTYNQQFLISNQLLTNSSSYIKSTYNTDSANNIHNPRNDYANNTSYAPIQRRQLRASDYGLRQLQVPLLSGLRLPVRPPWGIEEISQSIRG
jgi:hypothetical protein